MCGISRASGVGKSRSMPRHRSTRRKRHGSVWKKNCAGSSRLQSPSKNTALPSIRATKPKILRQSDALSTTETRVVRKNRSAGVSPASEPRQLLLGQHDLCRLEAGDTFFLTTTEYREMHEDSAHVNRRTLRGERGGANRQ